MNRNRGNALLILIILVAIGAGVAMLLKKEPADPANNGKGPDKTVRAKLKIAVLPDEDPSKLFADNEKFIAYLKKEIDADVELVPMVSYEAMIAAMVTKELDLAYFGPLSYCIAKEKSGGAIECFAAKLKNGSPTYTSIVIGNTAAGINSLADIKGKTMGYGSPSSTSSHLIPKSVLVAGGLKVDKGDPVDYKEVFLGKHDAVAKNVENGNCVAGGLSRPIYDGLIKDGRIDGSKVKVIAESDPIPQYPWAMQKHLDADLKERIKKAFFKLNKEEHADILKPLKAEAFGKMTDDDYKILYDLAPLLGIKLEDI